MVYAAEKGLAIIVPDTSPRGEDVPDDPEKACDFGLGAGCYVNATQAPWFSNYKMYDYVMEEHPTLVQQYFPIESSQVALSGHSMGGHLLKTISVFTAKICLQNKQR